MQSRMLFVGVALVALALYSSTALALDPLGPPAPGFKPMVSTAALEYLYSEMDLEGVDGSVKISGVGGSFELPDLDIECQTNKIYANLGLVVTKNWEVFIRLLGLSDASGEVETLGMKGMFDNDFGFAIGAGTKATFYEQDNLKVGWLAQFSWANTQSHAESGSGSFAVGGTTYSYQGTETADIRFSEFQFAIGPTYKLTDGVLIYGGPFFHFLGGELNVRHDGTLNGVSGTLKSSYDLDEKSIFGAYIGAQLDIAENASFYTEYQNTGDAYAIGINLTWRFH